MNIRKIFRIKWNNIEWREGYNSRLESYNVPNFLHKRFTLFTELISVNYFYQTTFSPKHSIVQSQYFRIKCEYYLKWIEKKEIKTIKDIKTFLKYETELIKYEPPLLKKWDKTIEEIIKENTLTENKVSAVFKRYIRKEKIKKIKYANSRKNRKREHRNDVKENEK